MLMRESCGSKDPWCFSIGIICILTGAAEGKQQRLWVSDCWWGGVVQQGGMSGFRLLGINVCLSIGCRSTFCSALLGQKLTITTAWKTILSGLFRDVYLTDGLQFSYLKQNIPLFLFSLTQSEHILVDLFYFIFTINRSDGNPPH